LCLLYKLRYFPAGWSVSFHYDLVEYGKQLSIPLKNPEIPITKLQLITNNDVEDVVNAVKTIIG